ncbi:protein kinase [Rhodococcus erythropolis]|uniref:serine/threonine protein kinase n=1 Tax=Rhodococcus erythropolis TaxID=1833 RepID=UPI001C9A4088|nr:protein kinase [Rhodococcus erythropolis]MBY6382364.1 protein kinase [Rhodococcus erythropolis]
MTRYRQLADTVDFPDELAELGFGNLGSIPHNGGQHCALYVCRPAHHLQARRKFNSLTPIILPPDQLVVVKLLDTLDHLDTREAEWADDAFSREISILREIATDRVPWFYDTGTLRDGRRYFVQDYVDGPNLHEYVRGVKGLGSENTVQSFDETEWLLLARSLAETLSTVHEHKVSHLDIKPANIVLKSGCNEPWLVDFGIARTEAGLQRYERIGLALSAGYAAPETMTTLGIRGPFSDVYSLCLTLAFAATGHTIRDSSTQEVDLSLLPPWASEALSPGLRHDHVHRLQHGRALLDHFDSVQRQPLPDDSPTRLVEWTATQRYRYSGPPTELGHPLDDAPSDEAIRIPTAKPTAQRRALLYLLNLGYDIEYGYSPAKLGIILMGLVPGIIAGMLIVTMISELT